MTPRSPRLVLVALIAALVAPAAVGQARSTVGAIVHPKAEQVARAMAAWYRTLEHGSVVVDVAIVVRAAGEDRSRDRMMSQSHDVAFVRPAQFALRSRGREGGITIVSDGRRLHLHARDDNRSMERPAPPGLDRLVEREPEIAALAATGAIEVAVLSGLLAPDPYARMMEAIAELIYVGSETIASRPAHHLCFRRPEVDLHMWVDAGPEPWLLRVRPDFSRLAAGDVAPTEVSIVYRAWSRARPADTTFVFEKPDGATDVATFFGAAGGGDDGLAVGDLAPDINLTPLAGDPVPLARHRGRQTVVLVFWASWSPPARVALGEIAALVAERAGDTGKKREDLVVYAINVGEDRTTIRTFLEKSDVAAEGRLDALTVAIDPASRIGDLFGVPRLPVTVVIDRRGVIRAGLSRGTIDEVRAALDALPEERTKKPRG